MKAELRSNSEKIESQYSANKTNEIVENVTLHKLPYADIVRRDNDSQIVHQKYYLKSTVPDKGLGLNFNNKMASNVCRSNIPAFKFPCG